MDKILLKKALEMSPKERVMFAQLILASIDYEEDKVRQLWLTEVESRIIAVNEGRASMLDFDELYNEG